MYTNDDHVFDFALDSVFKHSSVFIAFFFIFINHVCVTVKIWFLPLAFFLCYLNLSMCISHVVGETVTPRRYAGCTEWLSSEFGDIEPR